MYKLCSIMIVAILLARLTEIHDLGLKDRGCKDRIFTFLLILSLGLFCGLRTFYNDTVTYKGIYEALTPIWDQLEKAEAPVYAQGIGFYYLNSILKTIGFTTQDFLMFYAMATMALYVNFMRKFSCDLVLTTFLFFTTGVYVFALAAIKQAIATAICLWSIPLALDRKWLRFMLVVALGCMFHPYALVYFIVPLMMFEPWRGKTLLYMGIFIAVGFFLESLLGTVLSITDMMGAEYDAEEMLGDGVNIFRVAVSFVPMALAVFFGSELFRDAGEDIHLMFNLAMINALIMFVGLFGTANYFARLANYFLPAQMIVLPWMIRSAHPSDRRWLIPGCVVGYIGYLAYENAILRPFDSGFASMSLFDYLISLFR